MSQRYVINAALFGLAATAFVCGSLLAQNSPSPVSSHKPASPPSKTDDSQLPALKQILDRNAEVMGGSAAWSRLTSQQMTGVYQNEDGSRYLRVEILAKSPNKSLYKFTSSDDTVFRDVCDGKSAWIEDPRGGYHEFTGAALASHLRRSEFLDRGKVLLLAAAGKVTGTAKVGPYLTYTVEYTAQKNVDSKIYFDSDTGYIIRTEDVISTPDGSFQIRMDFADYRAVDGMKFPFRMRITEPGAVSFIRLTQLRNNVAIDDSAFLKPESAPVAQR